MIRRGAFLVASVFAAMGGQCGTGPVVQPPAGFTVQDMQGWWQASGPGDFLMCLRVENSLVAELDDLCDAGGEERTFSSPSISVANGRAVFIISYEAVETDDSITFADDRFDVASQPDGTLQGTVRRRTEFVPYNDEVPDEPDTDETINVVMERMEE